MPKICLAHVNAVKDLLGEPRLWATAVELEPLPLHRSRGLEIMMEIKENVNAAQGEPL